MGLGLEVRVGVGVKIGVGVRGWGWVLDGVRRVGAERDSKQAHDSARKAREGPQKRTMRCSPAQ